MMFYFPERRQYRRFKLHLPVKCQIVAPQFVIDELRQELVTGESFDVSEGGVGLFANQILPKQTEVEIKFVVKTKDVLGNETSRVITFSGIVVHSCFNEDRKACIGVAFSRIDQDLESKFFDLVCLPDSSHQTYYDIE